MTLQPAIHDPDFVLYVGDVLDVLRELPDSCVDCVVTSPPYWGLRDYGTGSWEGGRDDCDHAAAKRKTRYDYPLDTSPIQDGTRTGTDAQGGAIWLDECPSCGARRVDQQVGLEATPDAYVARIVAVFREVHRLLTPHGTVWLNLGDSYASGEVGRVDAGRTNDPSCGANEKWLEQKPRRERRIDQRSGLKSKDLVGIPWRVALALQADGWFLRSDVIWAKPNPMPESTTDRPTRAHEYVFLLTRRARYWFDQEAVREPHSPDGRRVTTVVARDGSAQHRDGERWPNGGRNIRSVWEIATRAYPEAHFATFPEELPRRCIVAGCPEFVCRVCGKPRERIVEREGTYGERKAQGYSGPQNVSADWGGSHNATHPPGMSHDLTPRTRPVGWSDCGHDDYRRGVVLDPFMGSGTVALVARKLNRRSIGIELNPDYAQQAGKRTQQLSLLADTA